MSEEGWEQKYIKEAFDTNWVVPMGPNVNAFEEDLTHFVTSKSTQISQIGTDSTDGPLDLPQGGGGWRAVV